MDHNTPPYTASSSHFADSLSGSSSGYHLSAENEFTLSSSSAIDLSATSAGIATSVPASPTNLVAREGSVSRRRLSWGRMQRQHVDMLEDPLRGTMDSGSATSSANINNQGHFSHSNLHGEDEFDGGIGRDANDYTRMSLSMSTGAARAFYGKFGEGANASESSLIPEFRSKSVQSEYNDVELDDDETRLTSGLPHLSHSSDMKGDMIANGGDVERTPINNNRRKSVRYSTQPSTGERLKSVKRNLRRMSLRVVNLAGAGLEERAGRGIRLPDDDGLYPSKMRGKEEDVLDLKTKDRDGWDEEDEDGELPDLAARLPIRGRTVGFLGPKSRVRLAMFRFLTYSYVHSPLFTSCPLAITYKAR